MNGITAEWIEAELKRYERLPHKDHQVEGIRQLINDTDPARGRIIHNVFALFDEVGAMKSKQCVDAGQMLYRAGEIDTIVVITPGFARSTWADIDPVTGEVAKHAWEVVPNVIHEFHGGYTKPDLTSPALHWVVSNYEFVRIENRFNDMVRALRGRKVWLLLDESWSVKGHSEQMKACRRLRVKRADRCTLLNGTPLSDGKPMDLFYQFAIMDPAIIGCQSKGAFKGKFCVMGGFGGKQVVDYKNLDELNARVAPYILNRETRANIQLPPMLPPIVVDVPLKDSTWQIYRSMRDDFVAWVGKEASISRQAIVKVLRLAQITSGFLGGLEAEEVDDAPPALPPNAPAWMLKRYGNALLPFDKPTTPPIVPSKPLTKEIGREKLDAFLHWLDAQNPRPHKILVWCRFRPELERCVRELKKRYDLVYELRGGQTPDERRLAKRALAPGGDPRSAAVVGNPRAGGASLNFAASALAVYLSNSPRLIERTQSIGRIERPGQQNPIQIVDFCATGPKGQRTSDHATLKALKNKDDMARWTGQQWRDWLSEV